MRHNKQVNKFTLREKPIFNIRDKYRQLLYYNRILYKENIPIYKIQIIITFIKLNLL